jgi:hypothetical protein
MTLPKQDVSFFAFEEGTLHRKLEIKDPPFLPSNFAFLQLASVERHVAALRCRSFAIEGHYIDRDYMEDHSVFYSRSLPSYSNSCRRVHFFNLEAHDVEAAFMAILETGARGEKEEFRRRCQDFSLEHYLGFSVIKPLTGSPLGRTVLRPPQPVEGQPEQDFECTRRCNVHLGPLRLFVRGLAFQQQDVGVSACATTALWSSLHKLQEFEQFSAATPARITMLAAQYALPFGRPMPSEGLSVDQMCQAVHAVGIAPNLYRVPSFDKAKSYIYSAAASGIPPVLIIDHPVQRVRHAITVAGLRVVKGSSTAQRNQQYQESQDLVGLFVHDDRMGPYLPTDIKVDEKGDPVLALPNPMDHNTLETWNLTHILIPTHTKIRLSFSSINEIAIRLVSRIHAFRQVRLQHEMEIKDPVIRFTTRILRSFTYLESRLLSKHLTAAHIRVLMTQTALPRYLGVVHLSSSYFEPIDVLIDTTGTKRNSLSLAVLPLKTALPQSIRVAHVLSEYCQSPVINA